MSYATKCFRSENHHTLCEKVEVVLNKWNADGFELKNIQFSSAFNDLSKEIIFSAFMVGKKKEVKESYRGYEKRRAEKGERILIVNADPQEERHYENGDEFTVSDSSSPEFEMIETQCGRYIDDTEYVVVVPEGETK